MLKIAACSTHHAPLGETPADLKPALRELGITLRRVNRFIELSVLGAARCRAQAGDLPRDTALILASDTGMLADTARIVAGLPQQRPPTPFEFMNVSGSMAGFHVAQQLGIDGANLTVHRRHAGLVATLQLLQIRSARQRHALIGLVEEGCWPLDAQRVRLDWPTGELAESSHWLYVDADARAPIATIDAVTQHDSLDDLARALRPSIDASTTTLCALQASRNDAPASQWATRLGLTRCLALTDTPCRNGGLAALALCRFAQSRAGGRLLIVERVADDEWHAVLCSGTDAG